MKKYLIVLLLGMTQVYGLGLNRCFEIASNRYQIPPRLLKAIAKTETKMNPIAIGKNKNLTYDIGIMQINSTWLKKLNKAGITQRDLADPCNNIQIGAWILADNIKRYGLNLKAIGAYNAVTPQLQQKYAEKVMRNMEAVE